MIRPVTAITEPRATALRAEADHVRDVAVDLAALAEEAETRLVPVQARMGPGVWAGEAAHVAQRSAELARADLEAAASQLREVAHDLRVTAATMEWRAADLLADGPAVGTGLEVGR